MQGFIVTWDVDSRNASLSARLKRFMFGYETRKRGKVYRYPGLAEREGVRYLGQSVVFVTPKVLPIVESFLSFNRIDCVVTAARIGSILPNWAERHLAMTDLAESALAAGEVGA